MTEEQARQRLAQAIKAAGGQRAFATAHGLSPAFVNDVVHKRRGLSGAICDALGIERRVTYSVRFVEKQS